MMTHAACRPEVDAEEILLSDGPDEKPRTWHERLLYDLTDAGTLLDCLEACEITERKLLTLRDGSFAVQWQE